MDKEKKAYSTPEFIVYGDLTEITKGNADGSLLDADFNSGTPCGDLTFSGDTPCC